MYISNNLPGDVDLAGLGIPQSFFYNWIFGLFIMSSIRIIICIHDNFHRIGFYNENNWKSYELFGHLQYVWSNLSRKTAPIYTVCECSYSTKSLLLSIFSQSNILFQFTFLCLPVK